MRMFAACINMKFTIHLGAELVLRKHAADCVFNNPYRSFAKSISCLLVSVTADIAGVVEVNFLQFFLACQNDFVCIDDDDIVTGINMRCVGRFILPERTLATLAARRPTVSPSASTIYHLRVMLPALAINVVFIVNDSS